MLEKTKVTVKELIEAFITAGKSKGVSKKGPWKPQTGFGYEALLKRHVGPTIGELRASKVSKLQIEAAAETWKQATSAGTANVIISSLLNPAYKWALKNPERGVNRNPVTEVQLFATQLTPEELERRALSGVTDLGEDQPDRKPGTLREVDPSEVYSAWQIRQIIHAAEPGLGRAFVMLAALCGLRLGEILGLRWSVTDLREGVVRVNRSMAELSKKKGGHTLQNPKTKSSYRELKLHPALIAELKRWRIACPPNDKNLVFVNPEGRPLFRSQCADILKACIERAGVEPVMSVHHLRHSYASQQLNNGVTPLEVAHLMGHSSPAITLAVYAKWAKQENSNAQEKLGDKILNASEPSAEEEAAI